MNAVLKQIRYQHPGPLKRLVNDPRNSTSVLPFKDLNWAHWWTDGGWYGGLYLHVEHKNREQVSRVRCRMTDAPRLETEKGKLYWLIDRKRVGAKIVIEKAPRGVPQTGLDDAAK